MTSVAVSIGTNIEREKNIRAALAALGRAYGRLRLSSVYANPAVGFEGPEFFNLALVFDTCQPVAEIVAILRGIEAEQGRVRSGNELDSRELDLDLLLYGDAVLYSEGLDVPRGEILQHAYVLKPLSQILPEHCHPVTGECYAAIWTKMESAGGALLEEVVFDLELTTGFVVRERSNALHQH